MEKQFHRDFGELDTIFEFVARFLADAGIEDPPVFEVQLIIEELFTNLVKYNLGQHDIGIRLQKVADALEIVLTDEDVEPFDITLEPEPNTRQPLEARRAGGLGLHLVRQMADEVKYDYSGRRGTITVRKKLVRPERGARS